MSPQTLSTPQQGPTTVTVSPNSLSLSNYIFLSNCIPLSNNIPQCHYLSSYISLPEKISSIKKNVKVSRFILELRILRLIFLKMLNLADNNQKKVSIFFILFIFSCFFVVC